MSNEELDGIDFTVDKTNLYKEEGYTDLKVASIRRLVPVDADGNEDPSRAAIYVGTTQLMTPQGPLPIQGALPANNFKEAMEVFPEAMRKATEQMIAEAQKMKDKEDSRIIVPGRE
jgi:hypothetical protein